jgi:hypothetical protein
MKNLISNNIPEKVPEIGILEWYRPGEYEQVEQLLEDLKKNGNYQTTYRHFLGRLFSRSSGKI